MAEPPPPRFRSLESPGETEEVVETTFSLSLSLSHSHSHSLTLTLTLTHSHPHSRSHSGDLVPERGSDVPKGAGVLRGLWPNYEITLKRCLHVRGERTADHLPATCGVTSGPP